MGKTTINYEVPDMTLVVQDKDMACWYASAIMLLTWKNRNLPGIFKAPIIDDATFNLYKANNGVQNAQIIPLARRLGLKSIPPICPTIEAMRSWLWKHGPLWTNGISHIVVIAGIRGDDEAGYEAKVYDPWPGNGITWRSLSGWYAGFDAKAKNGSTRDTSAAVEAVFLHG
jgi:hypothetical protein